MLLFLFTAPLNAGVELVADESVQTVFARENRAIRVSFRNGAGETVKPSLRMQLFQSSSATLAPVGKSRAWKTLEIGPGLSVTDNATVKFPNVRAGTRFQVQWTDNKESVIGVTDVWVYPTNLLKQLTTLAGERPLGVFDPNDQLKPLLRALKIQFADLEDGSSLDNSEYNLAIVGPFDSQEQTPSRLAERLSAHAKKGAAIVWIQPPAPAGTAPFLAPSAYRVQIGEGAIVVAQSTTLAHLADSPLAQLNLIRFAEMAVKPNLLRLPGQTN